MDKANDDSVFRQVERLGFHQVKAMPQHLLHSLPLASKQQRQEPGQLSSINALEPPLRSSRPAAASARASSSQLQQPGQLKLFRRNSSPPTGTLQVLLESSPAAGQFHLLPPLIGPSSPQRPGTSPPSPYLDVSIAASAFNSSQPHSPLVQKCRCRSPLPNQQTPAIPSSCGPGRLRSSWNAGDRSTSDGGDASVAAAGCNSIPSRWLGSPAGAAVVVTHESIGATARPPLSPVARAGVDQQQQRQRQLSPGLPHTSSGSKPEPGLNRAKTHKPGWDDNLNPRCEPTFEEAIVAWQQGMEMGAYGPKFLGSWAAVSSGQLNYSTAVGMYSQANSSRDSPTNCTRYMPTAAFQGSGDEAVKCLEGVVLKGLVGKPRLTLMQLQRGVLAISQLDSLFQLAAIGVLLRGGFWLAALQVAYADFRLMAEVLYEMKLVLETYQQWDSKLGAATWYWHTIDHDLFMRTFRGLDIIVQYQKLRRQVYSLEQLQHHSLQQLHHAGLSSSTANCMRGNPAALSVPNSHSSSGPRGMTHPQLADAEQQMLLRVLEHCLADVRAALAAQDIAAAEARAKHADADAKSTQQLLSVLEICPEAAELTAAAVAATVAGEDSAGVDADLATGNSSSGDGSTTHPLLRTLQVSSDWMILANINDAGRSATSEGWQQHVARAANDTAHSSLHCTGSSTAGLQAQQEALPAAATTGKELGPKRAAAASSAGLASSSQTASGPTGCASTATSTSASGSHGSSSSGSQPPRQRTAAAATASSSFEIQSVSAESVASNISNTGTMLLQTPDSMGSKGISRHAANRRSTSTRAHRPPVNPAIRSKVELTAGRSCRSSIVATTAALAAVAAGCSDKGAAPGQSHQQFSVFNSSVSATGVLGMLDSQQQQQLLQRQDLANTGEKRSQQHPVGDRHLKQQHVAQERKAWQQDEASCCQPEGECNSHHQHQSQELAGDPLQQLLDSQVPAGVPEPQQQAPMTQQLPEQHLTAQLLLQQQQQQVLKQPSVQEVTVQQLVASVLPERQLEQTWPAAELQQRQGTPPTQQQQQVAGPVTSNKMQQSHVRSPHKQQQQEPAPGIAVLPAPHVAAAHETPTMEAINTATEPQQPMSGTVAPTPETQGQTPSAEPDQACHDQQEQHQHAAAQEPLDMQAISARATSTASLAALPKAESGGSEPNQQQQQQLDAQESTVACQGATAAEVLADLPAAALPRPGGVVPASMGLQQQQQQGMPRAPSSPCSRPQSHQTSRCNSIQASRPCSAGVVIRTGGMNAATPTAGLGWLPQLSLRPASAAAGTVAAVSWSRPGSSSSSRMRPASAAGSLTPVATDVAGTLRPPASAGGLSTVWPGSAGMADAGAEAAAASLQRLRDSCAQQRRDIEQAAQTIMEAAGGVDGRLGAQPAAAATAMLGASGRPGSAVRPCSGGSNAAVVASAAGSRPSSALKLKSVLPSGSSNSRQQSLVQRLSSSNHSRPQTPAGHLLFTPGEGATAAGPAAAEAVEAAALRNESCMAVSMQLHLVPEESSQAVLTAHDSKARLNTSAVCQQQQQEIQQRLQSQLSTGESPVMDGKNAAAAPAAASGEEAGGRPARDGDGAAATQQQMQDELKVIVQMFQQRLEQTALMAQQLLAQQKARQAARHLAHSLSNSRMDSAVKNRPGSAFMGSGPCSAGPVGEHSGSSSTAESNLAHLGIRSAIQSGVSDMAPGLQLSQHDGLQGLGVEEPPSADEITEYARYLGMDPEQDAALLYIAEAALTAPCADGWTVHLDQHGNEFFHNAATQASTYEHPMDEHFRQLYQQAKQQQQHQQH